MRPSNGQNGKEKCLLLACCLLACCLLACSKNGYFSPKTAQIWEGTSRLGAPAPGRQR